MPHSCAIAGRCNAVLVEPPDAATTAEAFSSDLRVTMSRGRMLLATSSITVRPQAAAMAPRSELTAGTNADPGKAIPRASDTAAMVLAVYCPGQAPMVGHAARSS